MIPEIDLNKTTDEIRPSTDCQILDVCCGARMFYFDKENPAVIYMDNRDEEYTLCDGRVLNVHPDVVADFRKIPFEDYRFAMVVFDPPHLTKAGPDSWLARKYGVLSEDWPKDIRDGFKECMRVLKNEGTLIFKWNEQQVSITDVIKAIGVRPIFGSRRVDVKKDTTIWLVFMKGVS